MARHTALVLLVAAIAAACSESSPAAPTPPPGPMSGVWIGTATGPGTAVTIRLELQDMPFGEAYSVTGRYEARSPSGTITGVAGGLLFRGTVSLNMTPAPPVPCNVTQPFPANQWLLNLTLDGSRMTGDGAVTSCGGSEPAQATFTKQ